MPIVERPNGDENKSVLSSTGESEVKRRVSRVEFMLHVNEGLYALRMMAANHNRTAAMLDAMINQAKALESIPGVKVNYFYNPKINDFAVEAQEKIYGIFPVELDEDEEFEVGGDGRKLTFDDGEINEDPEMTEDGQEINDEDYLPIDSVDFYMGTEKLRNNLSQVAFQLTEQITTLNHLIEEIEDYEEEPGIQVDFFLNETLEFYSYAVKKKPPMGFTGVVEK